MERARMPSHPRQPLPAILQSANPTMPHHVYNIHQYLPHLSRSSSRLRPTESTGSPTSNAQDSTTTQPAQWLLHLCALSIYIVMCLAGRLRGAGLGSLGRSEEMLFVHLCQRLIMFNLHIYCSCLHWCGHTHTNSLREHNAAQTGSTSTRAL